MTENTSVQWAVLPLKKYAVFSGRAPRAEYWWFYLLSAVASGVADLIDGDGNYASGLISLAFFVPSLAVTVRRLHDTNRSGWWLALILLPLLILGGIAGFSAANGQDLDIGGPGSMTAPLIVVLVIFAIIAITLFVFMVTAGTEGENDYGPDPYGTDNLEEVFA